MKVNISLYLNQLFPGVVTEYKFMTGRKFRFDYAWPDRMTAFEVEGGIYRGKGGHTTIKGYEKDCEKYSLAAILGWKVIRATTGMCKDGRAIELLEKAFNGGGTGGNDE